MSLDLPKLLPQVQQMSESLAQSQEDLARLLPAAMEELQRVSGLQPEELQARIELAGERWGGAIPTAEPCQQAFPPPELRSGLHIIGADGSQIFPDRHANALYYLINIASLHMQYGSGEAPRTRSQPFLGYREEDLYGEDGFRLENAMIAARRDSAELEELARLAETCAGEPSLCLLDNGLLLWLALQLREQRPRQVQPILQAYLALLGRLERSGAALAGFIDRPNSANVLALLHLSRIPKERLREAELRDNPYRRLTDRMLFAQLLPAGHRSALFIHATPLNAEFRQAGHEVHFFYLNPGAGAQMARVEVPAWVARKPELLSWVHAGLLEEGRLTAGYPYVLARAHEMAVVGQAERALLEEMLAGQLAAQGVSARISQKALTKRWTSRRKRHTL